MKTKKPQTDSIEAALKRLDALSQTSRQLHFNVAKECYVILNSAKYQSRRLEVDKKLEAKIESLLPGMTKTSLEMMYRSFPNQADWTKRGVQGVLKEARIAQQSQLRDRATGKATGKAKLDAAGRANPGGGAGKMKIAQIEAMESERTQFQSETEKLRLKVLELSSKLDQANAKLVEVMLERDELRKEVARLQNK